MNKWKDPETAPKDGSVFIGVLKFFSEPTVCMFNEFEKSYISAEPNQVNEFNPEYDGCCMNVDDLLMWQELPKIPKLVDVYVE